jgi:hypothetical protein
MRDWGRSATALALWLVLIGAIVFAAVAAGWFLIFKPVVPHVAVAIFFATALALIALLLARLLAERFSERGVRGGRPVRRYHYLAYLFLFMVSAMGTVNAAFVLWEGSSVVRQDMAEVRSAYTALDVAARPRLVSAAHEKKRVELEALLTSLRQEIDNPNAGNYCGVGDAANAIIGRIREIVPRMPIIRGTGAIKPCDSAKAQRVWEAYAQSARATLERDPAYLSGGGPEKTAFLGRLGADIARTKAAFDEVEGLLGDPTAFARAEVQRPLAAAAASYRDNFRHAAALSGGLDPAVPETVDVTQSQELGSFAAFFDILASRLDQPKTWVYLLIALLLDVALVYFLTEAFRRFRHSRERERIDPYRQRGPHPKFLWVNPNPAPAPMGVRYV